MSHHRIEVVSEGGVEKIRMVIDEIQVEEKGIIIASPNGSLWRIKIDDLGLVSTEPA